MKNIISRIPSGYTQALTLATHLTTTGDISIREGMDLYKISSITKVISDLKRKYDFDIRTERKHDLTGKLYVRYHLAA